MNSFFIPEVSGILAIFSRSSPAKAAAEPSAMAAAAPEVTKAASLPSVPAMNSPDFLSSSSKDTQPFSASSIASRTSRGGVEPPSKVWFPRALMPARTPSCS